MTQVERQQELPFNPEGSDLPSFRFGKYFPNHHNPLTNWLIEGWKVVTGSGKYLTRQSIKERIGIELRYVASQSETVIDMGAEAAEDALKGQKDIYFVMVSTSFPIGLNVASEIAKKLNLPNIEPGNPDHVLDIYAACAGFVRGLNYLKEHEQKFWGKRILFVASEKYSDKVVDLRQEGALEIDPSMAQIIFSDGAIAMVFTYGEDIEILAAETHTLDHVRDIIQMPVDESLMAEPYIYEPVDKSPDYFRQQGPRVFKEVSIVIPKLTQEWLERVGIDLDRIEHIVPHQGSGRMVGELKERFRKLFNRDIVADDMEEGNFSSGSVLKALDKLVSNGHIDQRKIALLIGFGAGAGLLVSIAAVVIKGVRKKDY